MRIGFSTGGSARTTAFMAFPGNLLRTGQLSQARFIGHQPVVAARLPINRHIDINVNCARFLAGLFLRETPPGEKHNIVRGVADVQILRRESRGDVMRETLSSLLSITTLVFAVTSMLAVGCNYTLRQIVAPLRSMSAVVRAATANFVLVPLLAFGILQLIPLDRSFAIGLMWLASAAGAPFLIQLILAVEGDVGLSATLLVLLPVTLLYMPIAVPALFPDATISAMSIAAPLFLSMLLPLGVGLLLRAKLSCVAARLQPVLGKTSGAALLLLFALTVLLNVRGIMSTFGTGAILAAVVFIAGGFVIGYALGRDRDRRIVLGFGTAQRNIAAAMVVATQSFDDAGTLIMVVLTSVVSMLLLFPTAWVLRKRHEHDVGPVFRAA
jgi:BASS family bile acid:Na+ symporter